jgi:hypothetical protein
MTGFTAPGPDLRNGVDYVPAATLQSAFDALEWRDGPDAVRQLNGVCSSSATITTTATDVAGCTVSFTLTGGSSVVIVNGIFAVGTSVAAATVATGTLVVDGVTATGQAIKDGNSIDSFPAAQIWLPTLAAGAHTLKLQISKTVNVGTMSIGITDSILSVLVFDHR